MSFRYFKSFAKDIFDPLLFSYTIRHLANPWELTKSTTASKMQTFTPVICGVYIGYSFALFVSGISSSIKVDRKWNKRMFTWILNVSFGYTSECSATTCHQKRFQFNLKTLHIISPKLSDKNALTECLSILKFYSSSK